MEIFENYNNSWLNNQINQIKEDIKLYNKIKENIKIK